MSVTVAQLIARLQTLPQDAIVQTLVQTETSWHEYCKWETLDLKKHFEVSDLRDNPFISPDNPNFNKVIVRIGEQ